MADVIDAAKHIHINKWVIWSEAEGDIMQNPGECVYRYFVRTSNKALAENLPGVDVIGTLEGETVFTTGEMKEKDFMQTAGGKCAYIRIL